MIDNYKILGLDHNASLDEIKQAWRTLALKYHPDKNKNPGSVERFRECTEAYEALYNEIKSMMEPDSTEIVTKQGKVEIGTPNKFSFVEVRYMNNSFSGTLRTSQNSHYSVIFSDGYLEINRWINGEIWLVEMDNLVWIKKIERPNNAAVSDSGTVAFLHRLFRDSSMEDKEFMDLGGSLAVADKSGKIIFTYEFGSNIEGCAISPDGNVVSVATLYPDNSIYFFDVRQQMLLWKYKSHLRREPVLGLKFSKDQLDVLTGHTIATMEKGYTLTANGTLTPEYESKLNTLKKIKKQHPSEKVDSLLAMTTSSDLRDVTEGLSQLASFVKTKGSIPHYIKIVNTLGSLLGGRDDLFDPIWTVTRQIMKRRSETINPITQLIITKLKKISRYDDTRLLAVLGELGQTNPLWVKDDIQFIKQKLRSKIWNERRFAALAIGAIGSNDASLVMDVIPFLIEYAAHPENIHKELDEITHTTSAGNADWERDACIDSIGMIGKGSPESVKDAITMLEKLSKNAPSPYTIKKALRALNVIRRT